MTNKFKDLGLLILSILTLSLSSTSTAKAQNCALVPSGIVGWWQAEGNALDAITGSNGVVEPGGSFATGIVGQCFSFDGNSGCVLNDSIPSFNYIQNNFTIELWANPQGNLTFYPPNPNYLYGDGGMQLAVFPEFGGNGGQAGAGIGIGTNGIEIVEHAYNYLTTVLDYTNHLNGWVHVALVYSNERPVLYVNGAYVATGIIGIQNSVYPSKAFGGQVSYPWNTYGPYKGLLDEVSIYNRSLTAGEIAAIYNAGSAGKCFSSTPPVIAAQPANSTNEVGTTAIFSVTASGTAPLNYQWSFNGTNINNATNSILTLTNVQLSQAGSYAVAITNTGGSTNSISASLVVYALAPYISAEPAGETNIVGTTATFSVTATGTPPLSYQWSFNGTNITGATNVSLSLTNLQLAEAGNYAVLISSPYGSTNSSAAALTVNAAPPCDSVPAGIVDWWQGEGNALDFITGSNGIVESGVTFTAGIVGQCFTFPGVGGSCILNDNTPSLTSVQNSFTIEFWAYPQGNIILYPPATNNLYNGGGMQLAVFPEYGGTGGQAGAGIGVGTNGIEVVEHANNYLTTLLAYTNYLSGWVHVALVYSNKQPALYINGTNVATGLTSTRTFVYPSKDFGGETSYPWSTYGPYKGSLDEISIYNRSLTAPEIAGIYNAGSGGKCLNPNPPIITAEPANSTNQVGSTVTLSVAAAGSPPMAYQWSFNNTNIPGATGANLVLTNVQFNQAGNYSVLISNPYGSTNSSVAVLAVYALPPTITAQPANSTNLLGSTATFRVTATGTAPLSYQWSFNGTNINNATNSTLSLANVQFIQAGNYSVLIVNSAGTTNSAVASLTVYALPPYITAQPLNQTVTVGATATFNVAATGTAPLSYQWTFNGTNIVGAVGSSLVITNVQYNAAGSYAVQISNPGGSTNSSIATLAVNPLPACDSEPSGIVSWWQAEGNALNFITGTNGVVEPGASFTTGMVGQCFSFNGTNGCVLNDNTPSLTSIQNSFTIEFWAYPKGNMTFYPPSPNNLYGGGGMQLAVFPEYGGSGGQAGVGIGVGTNGIEVIEHAYNYLTTLLDYTNYLNGWVHVALVYSNKQPALYVNGAYVGSGITSTRSFVYPSKDFGGQISYPWSTYGPYKGMLDEISIYNRSLASAEIAAIYNAGSAGKCPAPPAITGQPLSRTNLVGTTATFSVTASGTTIGYQWLLNGVYLNNATNATLTLTNVQLSQAGVYSVIVGNTGGSTNSAGATLTVVVPPAITQQPQSQSVLTYNSASFTVAATGTGPLAYQWQKNGTNLVDNSNISGSTTTNLSISSVSVADAGNYTVLISSPYAATNSTVAVLTIPETVLFMGATNSMSGKTVTVPVMMNALGIENSFLASVNYDPAKLAVKYVQLGQATAGAYLQEVDSQTNNGFVGFAILLNNGSVVPPGTQEVAEVVFQALPVTNTTTVNLTFSDTPTARQLVDNNLNSLPAIYQGGSILISPAEYCADVYPRTNGDHLLTLQDWLEVGRLVAGLDVPTNTDEFLRADCAPRNAPDGALTVADWVQAGRYALGLDPLTLVTPPSSPSLALRAKPAGGPAPSRTLYVGNATAARGAAVNVPVQLACVTNENAVGMTVGYNTNQLRLMGISLGSAFAGGRINVNSNSVAGKVGIALALSPGASLAAGTNQVAVLQFTTSTNISGPVPVILDNAVVQLQVADTLANSLAAAYVNGSVTLPNQPSMAVAFTGGNLQFTWPLASGTFQVQTATQPSGPWTTWVLPLVTNGANVSATCAPTNQQQFFRLQGQ